MKFIGAIAFIIAAVFAAVSASPVSDRAAEELPPYHDWPELPPIHERAELPPYFEGPAHIRQRRATCDLLSVSTPFGSLNHAACAGHCLAMNRGFKGGRCIDGVCNCRR